jgi:hypothetical protein
MDNETTNKIILEKILSIISKTSNTQEEILNKLENFELRISNIEKSIKNNSIENLKELKYETLIVDNEEINKALNYCDYRSIIHIFRIIYKNKNNSNYVYPIRITGKRSYEYFDNNKWNPDLYGHHSINVLLKNIQDLFISFNNVENYSIDKFMENQIFIFKLSIDKYKKEIFKNIIEEVRINNT